MATVAVDKYQDILDSRDIIARIAELEEMIEDPLAPEDVEDEMEELAVLKALENEAQDSPDWRYGEALIRDSYFREYAEQLADDIGAINGNERWPLTYIDWDAAAHALQQDYMAVDFDGVTYWIHA